MVGNCWSGTCTSPGPTTDSLPCRLCRLLHRTSLSQKIASGCVVRIAFVMIPDAGFRHSALAEEALGKTGNTGCGSVR